ncbi:MAG: hypothetical protein RIE52_01745 [Balneola sp.]|jgi:putative effector of murein hydrolase LrgA (UPF0299 family)
MDIAGLSVGFAGIMIVVGILAMIFSGIRSLTQGKQDFKRIALMLVPVVVFAITYYALGQDFAKAGVMTAGVMMGGMILTIFLTGLRGTFKF